MGSRAETRTWVGQRKAETPVRADTEMPSSRFTWTRPTTHIYSYNREAQNIISSRSARATSVAANESRSAMTSTSGRQCALQELPALPPPLTTSQDTAATMDASLPKSCRSRVPQLQPLCQSGSHYVRDLLLQLSTPTKRLQVQVEAP